jgi:hypothetical protein
MLRPSWAVDQRREGDRVMGDLVYLGVTAVFFWLTWRLVRLCERL